MQDEKIEILDFLRRHPPFAGMADTALRAVVASVDVRYCKAGTEVVSFGQQAEFWHVIRSGAVEVFRRDGSLYNRLTEGGYFGEAGLLQQRKQVRFPVRALDDSLLYLIPEPVFSQLFEDHPQFADLVEVEDRTRLRHVVSQRAASNLLLSANVDSLLTRGPVTIAANATVREAARHMSDSGVSSLLVLEPVAAEQDLRMVGILTDRDLRSRLLAQGLGYDTLVQQIMSADLVTIDHQQPVFEAELQMLRRNVHRLPVLRGLQPIGVLSLSDVMRYESQNSLFVVGSIFRQTSVDDLAALLPDVRTSFKRMASEGASARMVGSAMAVIGRSFKQRLLDLGEALYGPPPVPYCFLALGSMARYEQLLVTDQDNAMVLDNRFDAARHDAYFSQLAAFVSDGLARCGYVYCTGGVMASNPKWRQPLRQWEAVFSQWINQPTPASLLNSNIFFDLDSAGGRTEWAAQLSALVAKQAKTKPAFLASMARNALLRTPPLGFFKDFVVEADGRHSKAINLKRRGTAPMTDLIRVHALAVGSQAVNSFERLKDVMAAGILPPGRGQDMHDALEFISTVRIHRQAEDLAADLEPDNSVEPDKLSAFERKSLRDAFSILGDAQSYLKFRYQPGRSL